MDNNRISPKNTPQTQPPQSTEPVKKNISPSSLLKGVTGGASRLEGIAEKVKTKAQEMGGALASAASDSQLKAPSLPETSETKSFFGKAMEAAKKVQDDPGSVHRARRLAQEKAGTSTPSGAPFDPNDDVSTLYKAGYSKLGTDEKAIRELMWDRTPEQREVIAQAYTDRTKRDLWNDLDKEFEDPNDKRMMKAFRDGDNVAAAAAGLVDATTGSTSKGRVEDILARLTPEEARQAQAKYKDLHPKGQELKDWTDRKFSAERKTQVEALMEGDSDTAELAGMQRSLRKGKGAEVVAQLRNLEPEARREFIEKFNAEAKDGQDMTSLVQGLKGTDKDQAQALVAGNQAAADAALIQDAVDGMGSNKQKLWSGLGSEIEDPAERKAYMQSVEQEYNKLYGPDSSRKGKALAERLQTELGGENREKALTLLQEGEVPPQQQMKFALSGSRKDGQALASLIEKHGPEKARQMYTEATMSAEHPEGRELDSDIQDRLGGRGRYEAKIALQGKPETPEEKVARAVDRTRFETNGLGGVFTDSDELLKANTARAENALEQLQAARASGDEGAIAEWTTRIDELTGYAKADTEVFRSEKDGAIEMTAAVAAGVAAAGAIAVTGGAAAPLVAMAAGATVNYGTRNVMAGNSYDQNDAAKDLLVGAMEGVGVKGGAVIGKLAKSRVQSQIRNASGKRLLGNVTEGAADGAFGGALMAATETAAAEGTWENGAASGLGKVLQGGATGSAFGTVMGGSLGAGTSVAGEALSKIRAKGPEGQVLSGTTQSDIAAQPVKGDAPSPKGQMETDPSTTAGIGEQSPQGDPTAAVQKDPSQAPEVLEFREKIRLQEEARLNKASAALEAMPEADKAKFQKLVENLEREPLYIMGRADAEGWATSLSTMLAEGTLNKIDSKGVRVLDRLASIAENPRHSLFDDTSEILPSLVNVLGRPGTIHQGSVPTCAPATAQFLHVKRDPAEFARIMDELTGPEGKAKLASGETMTLSVNTIKSGDSPSYYDRRGDSRDIISAAYQDSAASFAKKTEYSQGFFFDSQGISRRAGLTPEELETLNQGLFGKNHKAVARAELHSPEGKAHFEKLVAQLPESEHKGLQIAMEWAAEGEHTYHAVTLLGLDDKGQALIRNSQIKGADTLHHDFPGSGGPTRMPSTASIDDILGGVTSMDFQELQRRMISYIEPTDT